MTKRIGKRVKDESGIVLPLAIIMIVLVSVMGAGLLTFVITDQENLLEVNQGQNAFEMADAGAQAAKMQLKAYPDASLYTTSFDWSDADGKDLGMDNANGKDARVRIEPNTPSTGLFTATSTGTAGNAKRKIQTIYKATPLISNSIPPAHFTWADINQSGGGGNCNLDGSSMFAMGNASFGGSFSICATPDQAYKKWAATADTYSYPNPFNSTARSNQSAGIAARGTISTNGGSAAQVAKGTRSFDSTTTPRVVPDYNASPLLNSQKIAFPFGVASSPPASDLETLRQRALELERQNPGSYYYDTNPGNEIDDSGITSNQSVTSWPTGSSFSTVVFYEFATSGRKVSWDISSSCSSTDSRKGVIAVDNGSFEIGNNNGGFNGAVVIRGGTFSSGGNACMTGYVNSSGTINMSGGFQSGSVPPLTSLPAFQGGSTSLVSWRELYQ